MTTYNSMPKQVTAILGNGNWDYQMSYAWPYPSLMLPDPKPMNLPQDKTPQQLFDRLATAGDSTDVIIEMRPIFYGDYSKDKSDKDGTATTTIPERTDAVTKHICDLAKSANKQVWFYFMGRGIFEKDGSRNVEDEAFAQRVEQAAQVNQATLVPVHLAWNIIATQHPDIALHPPRKLDDRHPSGIETYLTIMCFYAAMTNSHPAQANLPLTIMHKPVGMGEKNGKPHKKRLPAEDLTIPAETALALQNAAWQAWQQVQNGGAE